MLLNDPRYEALYKTHPLSLRCVDLFSTLDCGHKYDIEHWMIHEFKLPELHDKSDSRMFTSLLFEDVRVACASFLRLATVKPIMVGLYYNLYVTAKKESYFATSSTDSSDGFHKLCLDAIFHTLYNAYSPANVLSEQLKELGGNASKIDDAFRKASRSYEEAFHCNRLPRTTSRIVAQADLAAFKGTCLCNVAIDAKLDMTASQTCAQLVWSVMSQDILTSGRKYGDYLQKSFHQLTKIEASEEESGRLAKMIFLHYVPTILCSSLPATLKSFLNEVTKQEHSVTTDDDDESDYDSDEELSDDDSDDELYGFKRMKYLSGDELHQFMMKYKEMNQVVRQQTAQTAVRHSEAHGENEEKPTACDDGLCHLVSVLSDRAESRDSWKYLTNDMVDKMASNFEKKNRDACQRSTLTVVRHCVHEKNVHKPTMFDDGTQIAEKSHSPNKFKAPHVTIKTKKSEVANDAEEHSKDVHALREKCAVFKIDH